MIQFLKESTFAVNEVLSKSIHILKGHYFSIGGLLLSIFLLFVVAHELTFYLEMSSILIKIPLMLLFAVTLLGLQLFLLCVSGCASDSGVDNRAVRIRCLHRPGAGFGVGPQGVAAKQPGEYRVLGDSRIKVEQGHGRIAGNYQAWRVDGFWQHMGRKGVTQAGETVIEGQFVEGFQ